MKKLTILDTSVGSENLGDFIIMDAVNEQLDNVFPSAMKLSGLTHDRVYRNTYRLIKNSEYTFVGGTNLLSSNMNSYNQWKINLIDSFFVKNILLLGVGWWQYQQKPNAYTKYLLSKVLNKDYLHSVRDSYTEENLRKIGFTNVLNTACPTMWGLTEKHCQQIPQEKSNRVVFTLTDYNKDLKNDYELIKTLVDNYKEVFFWPQGTGDHDYFQSFKKEFLTIETLAPTLKAFNNLLNDPNQEVDFVGTRLHAGVRAIQSKRKAIIIGIDNRAKEKAKDFNLTVLDRSEIGGLKGLILSSFKTEIKLPLEQIEQWKSQF